MDALQAEVDKLQLEPELRQDPGDTPHEGEQLQQQEPEHSELPEQPLDPVSQIRPPAQQQPDSLAVEPTQIPGPVAAQPESDNMPAPALEQDPLPVSPPQSYHHHSDGYSNGHGHAHGHAQDHQQHFASRSVDSAQSFPAFSSHDDRPSSRHESPTMTYHQRQQSQSQSQPASRPGSGLSVDKYSQSHSSPYHEYQRHPPPSAPPSKNSVVIKVGMVGDAQIGKTSLMVKYVEGSWDEDYIQTLGEKRNARKMLGTRLTSAGVNFMEKTISIRNTEITFSIWDLGGQREFVNMLPLVCNDAVAILFMFDLTRKSTLNSIKEWYRQGRGFNKTAIPLLVGTKYDHFVNFPREDQEEISIQVCYST